MPELTDLILPLLYLTALMLFIWRARWFEVGQIYRKALTAVFGLKVVAGFILFLIYTQYYEDRSTGDALRFFDDALILWKALPEKPLEVIKIFLGVDMNDPAVKNLLATTQNWDRSFDFGMFNDNTTMIRANMLMMPLSVGNFHVHTVFFCFLALLGQIQLFKVFSYYFPLKKLAAFVVVFLLPSVLFWSSAPLKEALHFFFFGFAIRYSLRLFDEGYDSRRLLIFIGSAAVLLMIKSFVLLALLPAWICLWILKTSGTRRYWLKVVGIHLGLLALALLLPLISPSFSVIELMQMKQQAFYNVALLSEAGSVIDLPRFHNMGEWLIQSPLAVVTALFRPFLGDSNGALYVPAILENLALILLILIMIWNFRLPSLITFPLMLVMISSSIILLSVIGSTVPVLGALVRYKTTVLPFVGMTIVAMTHKGWLFRRIPWLQKLDIKG